MRLVQFKGYLFVPIEAHNRKWLMIYAPNAVPIVAMQSEKDAVHFVDERLSTHQVVRAQLPKDGRWL